MRKTPLPTDRQILQCIFDMYEARFPGQATAPGVNENDPYMAIDIKEVATKLGCHENLLFGRLYYSIDRKYGYTTSSGSKVHLFAAKVGDVYHAINFSVLCATLADLRQENHKYNWTLGVAIAAAVLSVLGLVIPLLAKQ